MGFINKFRIKNSLVIIPANMKKLMTIDEGKKMGRFSLFARQAGQYYTVGASGVGINLGILFVLLI